MFGIHDFGLFLAAGILLNLTPGPDTVYILGRSVAQGREAGIASALGICFGSIFHTCAAALGLSAILATSALAFGAIKLLGGAYLINAGRGKLQVDADILAALEDGALAGASLDVFPAEPLPPTSPLWAHPNVFITPHNAAVSDPRALAKNVLTQIERFARSSGRAGRRDGPSDRATL